MVHKNPPLTALNDAYRADNAQRRDEADETIGAVVSALRGGAAGRRTQKPLAPHHIAAAQGQQSRGR